MDSMEQEVLFPDWKRPRKRRRSHREYTLQESVWDLICKAGKPGLVAFHVPNEGKRTPKQGAQLKRIGLLPGASDLVLFFDRRFHLVEVKDEGEELTDEQEAFLRKCRAQGGRVAVVRSLREAEYILAGWGLLRISRSGAWL